MAILAIEFKDGIHEFLERRIRDLRAVGALAPIGRRGPAVEIRATGAG